MATRSPVYDPETDGEPTYKAPADLGPGHDRPAGNPSDPRGDALGDVRKAEAKGSGKTRGSTVGLGRSGGNTGTTGGGNFSFNPKGDAGVAGTGALKSAEFGAASTGTASGNFFTPTDRKSRVKLFLKANRRKALIGGGGLTGIALIVAAGFMLLIPLKIEHMVTNLQNRTFASSESAVSETTQNMFERYMVTKVLPAYKDCGTTVSKNCTPKDFGANPVGNLYRSWSDARLENTLAEKYGIEFKYDKSQNTWTLKAPGEGSKGVDIGKDGDGLSRELNKTNNARNAFKAALKDALKDETRWKQVMYRYKVGRLLEGKYGIVRCIMYCGKQDALRDNAKARKNAAKLYVTQRVLTPHLGSSGIVLECMLNPNCHPEDTSPTSFDDTDGSPVNGENGDTDTKQRHTLVDLARNYPGTPADKLLKDYEAISDKGFQKYVFEKIFEKIGFGKVASQAADAIPIIGAVKAASDMITFVNNAGPAVSKIGYITNAAAASSLYMMYRTYADEIHTGHVNATEVGSMVDSLGPGNTGPASDPPKGGTASAEATPLYQNMFGGSDGSKTASILDSVLPSAAAASQNKNSNDYLCDDGKPVPEGQLVCREEVLGSGGNAQLNSAHDFLNLPVIGQITDLAGVTSGVFATFGDFIGGIITAIPGVGQATEAVSGLISNIFKPFVDAVITYLIPNPFGSNMSGGRTFDMMAAGADVSGNIYANAGLGGQALTDQQAATIYNEYQSGAEQSFNQRPLFARVFDTDSERSLVSKLAMSIPFGKQAAAQSAAANMLNPMDAIGRGFGSMLSGKADAALTARPDPFGVTQYGYPEGTIPKDPETYWENHCSDDSSKAYQNDAEYQNAPGGEGWVGQATSEPPDEKTGMPVNRTTNPCLLIKAAVGSAGAWFNTDLLTPYDRADQSGDNSADADSSSSGAATVSGEPQELAKALVDSGRLSDQDGRYMEQIKAIANGNSTCNVNPYVLEMLYGVVVQDKHSVVMSSLNRYCTGVQTASGTGSYHYRDGGGHAIDVVGFDGGAVTGSHNAATLGYLNAAAKYLPKGTGFGQVESCGSGFNIPAGDYPVPDSCNHQHIQVPVKQLK